MGQSVRLTLSPKILNGTPTATPRLASRAASHVLELTTGATITRVVFCLLVFLLMD
jgi:hypothetical protein